MQFFERQEAQRSYTHWLVAGFIAAVLMVTAVINLVVLVGLGGNPMYAVRHHPAWLVWISAAVIVTVLIASWRKSSELRAGGAVVARSLGGVPVTAADSDLKRKRLLNIVEEMAIAARIRKPQVFVLTEEPCINAFAAGHSPDEAAVVVTQGALELLDRDQLQAVIGHEFSHVLNGDMKINMRLTAWIFGLFVLTDFATRIMRAGKGGKNFSRVKLIAFGVFLAGSAGLIVGRLLQAAVSRRREYLADASAVQFTRNPLGLQGAFIAMAANPSGSRLQHVSAVNLAHMFFSDSDPPWADKLGTGWFSTHPPLEERVRALDARISSTRFRVLVSDERRKREGHTAQTGGDATAGAETASGGARADAMSKPLVVATMAAATVSETDAPTVSHATTLPTSPDDDLALAETLPSGVRLIAGRTLPPDVLRNRLSHDQQDAILEFIDRLEKSGPSVQATYVAAMLACEPAKWRMQLTKLAPLLGIELMKETQAQIARIAALAPAARLPMLQDLLPALETFDPADRKRLRAVARAFAPTVATGDMLRFAVTRVLEKRLGKPTDQSLPVPLTERASEICVVYAALSQCRFGASKQGLNSYRAGLMGMLTPQKWSPYPETLIKPEALDAALAALTQMHPAGKRSFSEGTARVIAVGGQLTVPQVDLLRAVCLIVDCPVPVLAIDVVFDDVDAGEPATQASAR
jgi:Zn-dependent protease with chaperone function